MRIIALLIALLGATSASFAQDDISQSTGIIGNGRLLGAKTYDGQTTVGILGIDSSGNTIIKALSGSDILFAGTIKLANNTYLQARNAAGSADIDVLKVDGSDDTIINSDASDTVKVQIGGDANRLFTFDAASDTALTLDFGDGATAQQAFSLTGTLNTDRLILGGGATAAVADGAFAVLGGNTNSTTAGHAQINSGNVSGAGVDMVANSSDGNVRLITGSGAVLALVANSSGDITTAGNAILSASGKTLQLQEATAGSKCMGSLTANGATPVVTSTTCAKTASRIFMQRTSAETGTVNAWISAISDGVSFSITSEAADTGTYNWFIINEAA